MLELNYKYAESDIIGNIDGLYVQKEFENYKERIQKIVAGIIDRKDVAGQNLQWLNLKTIEETVWYIKEYAALVENRFDNVLVLGIGGSVLGGIAVTKALLKPFWNFLPKEKRNNYPRIFFLDNIDPDEITGLLEVLDLKKTVVNVITKSGSTAETMAQFMIIKDRMEKELGDDYRKNIVATTDKNVGILRQIAEQEGYKTFIIPDDIGGRFSVFSSVGLLPMALVGIDIEEIMNGIKDIYSQLCNENIYENIAAQSALINYLLDTKKEKNISVMMPYSSRLQYFADWYIELWAESLGKEKDIDGNVVNTGQTPIKALGVVDQHSQIQLYNEGPNNKVINFIRIKEFDNKLEIPKIFEYTGIGYLGGKSINDLMNAEADSTRVVLSDYNRPTLTYTIPKLNGYYLAQLLFMFEMQATIAAALFNVDAFNQPSIEQAKNYTYAIMGRQGYEDSANNLKQKMFE